jgi:hypothetical protein
MKATETMRPLQDFLTANGLEPRHLETLAAEGYVVPVVEIDGDTFILREEGQELIAKLKVRALIDATSGNGLKLGGRS